MSYFLSSQKLHPNQLLELSGEEAKHILLSRRMKVGEQLNVQGPDEKRFVCELVAATKNNLSLKTISEIEVPKELPIKIYLFQSIVSEKALDFIFQKSTELGAAGILLFNSQNTAIKLLVGQFASKSERWNKILWEAAKQCDRSKIPELIFFPTLNDILPEAEKLDQVFILDASAGNLKSPILNPKSLALIIGPEGGFTPQELDQLKTIKNSHTASIGPFTLRAETAAIAGLSIYAKPIT
jgi:16S rRNA (uracil1498-N3)-methyltransferase